MIYVYLEEHFKRIKDPCIIEVGAHIGTDTVELSRFVNKGSLICFEPDPRNAKSLRKLQDKVQFELVEKAVGKEDGEVTFYQSFGKKFGVLREITDLSSTKKPKKVKDKHPWVEFAAITVQATTLDSYCEVNELSTIDLIWADIQGGELDLVLGAQKVLQNTKLFYFECVMNSIKLYADKPTYEQILNALPSESKWSLEFSSSTDVLLKRS